MEIKPTSWLEDFAEACRDIQEDTLLLEALSAYASNGAKSAYFPYVFRLLCNYLSQHAAELRRLEKRLGLEPPMESSP